MDTAKYTPTILSLCPGIRGIERGLERIFPAIRVAAYVEIETFIAENLLAAMEAGLVDAAPIWTNLKTFNPAPFRDRIDGIIGGYPCQPFSYAGKRNGTEDPRHLWPYIANCIRTIRPVWCFFENVRGHLSCGYDIVRAELQGMGYTVREGIYSAEEVGAPHRRERLFILAVADSAGFNRGLSDSEGWIEGDEVAGGGQVVGNTEGNDQCDDWNQSGEPQREAGRSGDELENSVQLGVNRRYNAIPTICKSKIKTKGSGVGLANTNVCRGGENTKSAKLWAGRAEQSPRYRGVRDETEDGEGEKCRWPARPDTQQFSWEEPRTTITEQTARLLGGYGKKYPQAFPAWQIEQVTPDGFTGTVKPGLDSTVDGYNFREDILRALGNSVVEQTAELAFRDLIRKHSER